MGRPKGSKNKPKTTTYDAELAPGGVKVKAYVNVRPKRAPKAKAEPPPIVAAPVDSIAAQRAALKAEMAKPLSAAETKKLLAEATAEAAKVRDPQLVVNDAVAQVIKPNWMNAVNQDGCKHFYVKSQRNGESVSFEAEKWQRALQTHGLPNGSVTFKIEGLGMEPGGDTGSAMYRVMIG